MSFGPFSALYFMIYEHAKGLIVNNDPQQYIKKIKAVDKQSKIAAGKAELTFGQSMLCGMWAGALAGTITNPLDMGKYSFFYL